MMTKTAAYNKQFSVSLIQTIAKKLGYSSSFIINHLLIQFVYYLVKTPVDKKIRDFDNCMRKR